MNEGIRKQYITLCTKHTRAHSHTRPRERVRTHTREPAQHNNNNNNNNNNKDSELFEARLGKDRAQLVS